MSNLIDLMGVNESDSIPGQIQDISSIVQKIMDEIKSLEKELELLQNSCTHSNYTIKNSSHGPENGFSLRRICDTCQAILGYPTQEEIKKWEGF